MPHYDAGGGAAKADSGEGCTKVESGSVRRFLFIGSNDSDFSIKNLKVSGAQYRRKSLTSRPENWESITDIIKDPDVTGVVAKLTSWNFKMICSDEYFRVAESLFAALGNKPHLLLAHESILSGESTVADSPQEYDEDSDIDSYWDHVKRTYLTPPDEAIRVRVLELLDRCSITVIPYRTNAEMYVLSDSFLGDHENNLLFRVYVPSGRLYATEADRLLELFQDWLTQVGRHAVRRDGYSTAAGRVYEFFGGDSLLPQLMNNEFDRFSSFLSLCVSDPDAAEGQLSASGIDYQHAAVLVTKYGKAVRRLNVDMRQQRETRILQIRHRLESEILDACDGFGAPPGALEEFIDNLTPGAQGSIAGIMAGFRPSANSGVVINQQIFNGLQGTVVQSIDGTVNLGAEAREILDLVASHGGSDRAALESAVHELEDPDARNTDRLTAKQRLKGFLMRLGGTVEAAGLSALQKYLEAKMGG
ncbi:hypothetical protein ACIRBX_17460 [Kitasatospora sp. NPDC096147]|uniref:hypothetical protein n=1 Tax=Kitasatospora sp. NPDC096147 TaxID=3364093 RepID=UPI0037F50F97